MFYLKKSEIDAVSGGMSQQKWTERAPCVSRPPPPYVDKEGDEWIKFPHPPEEE